MKVQVEDVSPIEKRLSIEVDFTVVEKELAQAYAALSRQVKVPGFRPGKVPRRILEQRYKGDVESDVTRRVQVQAFLDAVKEHKVHAVGEPHLTGGKIVSNTPFAFSARVEVKPKVTVADWKGLTLAKTSAEVPPEKVTEQIDRMLQSRSTLEVFTDRDVVATGDFAVIDFDATIDGQPFKGNNGRDVTVEVVAGELVEGNMPQLEGVKVGEQKTFDYAFPADYRLEEAKGKTAQFVATVKALKAKKAPVMDDAFAQTLGVPTVDELKARVRGDLERAEKNRVQVDERDALFKAMSAKNPFEVPNSMIERGVEVLLEGALGSMARSGIDPRMLNLDWNKLREEMRPRAESEVRGQLLMEALWTEQKIEVTDEDLEKKLEELSTESGAPLPQVRKQYKDGEAKEALRIRVLEDKTIALIKEHVKYE